MRKVMTSLAVLALVACSKPAETTNDMSAADANMTMDANATADANLAAPAAFQINETSWEFTREGKRLVPPEEMVAKLRAACAARTDRDTVIIARTDARGVTDIDDAIARARQYVQGGADWIFPEALTDRGEFARFAEAIDVPLVANMTEFGRSPLLGIDELADLGYAAVLYPVTLLRIALKAMEAALVTLAADGTQADLIDLMCTREELYEMLEYDEFRKRQEGFGA